MIPDADWLIDVVVMLFFLSEEVFLLLFKRQLVVQGLCLSQVCWKA